MSKLNEALYEDERFKDVSFLLDSGEIIKAHRAVLMASGSNYFRSILGGNFWENWNNPINIREVSKDEFTWVLKSIYEIEEFVWVFKSIYEGAKKVEKVEKNISVERQFDLSVYFDTFFTISGIIHKHGEYINRKGECNAKNEDIFSPVIRAALKHRPVFDSYMKKIKINPFNTFIGWNKQELEIEDEDVACYLIDIFYDPHDPYDSSFSGRIENYLSGTLGPYVHDKEKKDKCYSCRYLKYSCGVKNIDIIHNQYPRVLIAMLKRMKFPFGNTKLIEDLTNLGYYKKEQLEIMRSLEDPFIHFRYTKIYVLSNFPLSVGRIIPKKDVENEEEIEFWINSANSTGRRISREEAMKEDKWITVSAVVKVF